MDNFLENIFDEQAVLKGTVENVIFHNEDNGFTVFSFLVKDGDEDRADDLRTMVCVGNMPRIASGESLKVIGSYVNHAVYGRQLKVDSFEKVMPDSESSIEKYLGSGVIRGIRERLAKKIVKKFGRETLTVIEEYPERLAEIKGITIEKAMEISAMFHEQSEQRRVIMYLQDQGIAYSSAAKLYKRYRGATIDVVKDNPYVLAEEIDGIGFKTADSIAFKLGVSPDSPHRVRSGIKYVLNRAADSGHVYLPKDELIKNTVELLEIDGVIVSNMLSQLQMERVLCQESLGSDKTAAVYLNYFYYCEGYIAKMLLELSANVIDKSDSVADDIKAIERKTGIMLADSQKEAVADALRYGVLVITGGPGTGKTTIIKTIIGILQKLEYRIELAAPTGRAAKRMSEATGMEAKTIHRLLEISFDDEGTSSRAQSFGKNEDSPLETDVVIIDETSMVDIGLMSGLLRAIAPGTRLVLVGDVDQLPSVGPGNVLNDIIASGSIRVVRLTEIFRQARESAIVMNAHRINHGEYPLLNEREKDFFFVKRETPEQIVEATLDLILNRLPKFAGCKAEEMQVLTPMRKGPLGVVNMNRVFQQYLNPPAPGKREKELRSSTFREGDRVMQIKNNYGVAWRILDAGNRQIDEGLGVFNGDVGVIRSIREFDEVLTVMFDDNKLVDYDFSRLDELELAYAITIHKSQGSEYRVIIIPIHSGPPMLMSRNLLYTGVTRAKELVVIIGIQETLKKMVDNDRQVARYTSLAGRIQKLHRFMRGGLID